MKVKSRIPRREVLKRPKQYKKYNAVILIVTEGEKTEPIYFRSMKKYERLESSKIEVVHSLYGTNPINVVDYAIDRKKSNLSDNKKTGEAKYDKIYCVIDRDDHEHYHDAINKAKAHNMIVIRSIPCFEIWYYLHYCYTTRCYNDRELLIRELRKKIAGYQKSDDLYVSLRPRLQEAIKNAEKLIIEQSKVCNYITDHPNPMTEVHLLIADLLEQNI